MPDALSQTGSPPIDRSVARLIDVQRPGRDSIRVNAIVAASTREEARQASNEIFDAARSAAGKRIEAWSTMGWWGGHDCIDIPMTDHT